jgi:hypothetical protein
MVLIHFIRQEDTMDFDKIKKSARAFLISHTPDPAAAPQAPKRRQAARVSPMSPAQQKLYGSLTADKGFSIEDARRQFLPSKGASPSQD